METFIKEITQIMQKNFKFSKENTKEVHKEFVELVKYSAYCTSFVTKHEKLEHELSNWCMVTYLYHILMPFSFGIYIDFLNGNLPVCFFQLRLMLEAMVKCYYADSKYPRHLSFQQKLELIETENKTVGKLMEEVGSILMIKKKKITSIWHEISKEWIHPKGVINKIVKAFIESEETPPYRVILPIHYEKIDVDDIKKLGRQITKFRKLLNLVMESWETYI